MAVLWRAMLPSVLYAWFVIVYGIVGPFQSVIGVQGRAARESVAQEIPTTVGCRSGRWFRNSRRCDLVRRKDPRRSVVSRVFLVVRARCAACCVVREPGRDPTDGHCARGRLLSEADAHKAPAVGREAREGFDLCLGPVELNVELRTWVGESRGPNAEPARVVDDRARGIAGKTPRAVVRRGLGNTTRQPGNDQGADDHKIVIENDLKLRLAETRYRARAVGVRHLFTPLQNDFTADVRHFLERDRDATGGVDHLARACASERAVAIVPNGVPVAQCHVADRHRAGGREGTQHVGIRATAVLLSDLDAMGVGRLAHLDLTRRRGEHQITYRGRPLVQCYRLRACTGHELAVHRFDFDSRLANLTGHGQPRGTKILCCVGHGCVPHDGLGYVPRVDSARWATGEILRPAVAQVTHGHLALIVHQAAAHGHGDRAGLGHGACDADVLPAFCAGPLLVDQAQRATDSRCSRPDPLEQLDLRHAHDVIFQQVTAPFRRLDQVAFDGVRDLRAPRKIADLGKCDRHVVVVWRLGHDDVRAHESGCVVRANSEESLADRHVTVGSVQLADIVENTVAAAIRDDVARGPATAIVLVVHDHGRQQDHITLQDWVCHFLYLKKTKHTQEKIGIHNIVEVDHGRRLETSTVAAVAKNHLVVLAVDIEGHELAWHCGPELDCFNQVTGHPRVLVLWLQCYLTALDLGADMYDGRTGQAKLHRLPYMTPVVPVYPHQVSVQTDRVRSIGKCDRWRGHLSNRRQCGGLQGLQQVIGTGLVAADVHTAAVRQHNRRIVRDAGAGRQTA